MGGEIKKPHNPKVVKISQLYIQEAVLIRSFSREELKDFANRWKPILTSSDKSQCWRGITSATSSAGISSYYGGWLQPRLHYTSASSHPQPTECKPAISVIDFLGNIMILK